MTRNILVLSLLPLAFVVGCEPIDNGTGDGNVNCGDNCGDDDGDLIGELSATLRSVAPYEWVGYHSVVNLTNGDNEIARCEDVNECELALVNPSMYDPSTGRTYDYVDLRMSIRSDTFDCVSQELRVNDDEDGETFEFEDQWLGEGTCGLAPDGDYDGWSVDTIIADLNDDGVEEVVIRIRSWMAVVTGTSFFYAGTDDDEGDYTVEGSISDDLVEIYFLIIYYDDDGIEVNRLEDTITLED